MTKSDLRRLVRKLRRGLTPESARRAGDTLAGSISFSLPPFSGARVVAGYLSLPGELPPEPLMARLHEAGRKLLVPAWDDAAETYRFAVYTPGAPLRSGPFHVLQPEAPEFVDPEGIDLVLVPGLAFDPAGHRAGFGGGFYDRLLCRCPASVRLLGLAFDFQVFPSVPAEPHDIPVHGILTPTRHLL